MTDDVQDRANRRVGIRDVAAAAGVGISTVSRVLSGSADVRPELRERVLAAAAELGYQPDILAQSLRRGATRSMGFIADDLQNHVIAEIATGAEGVLRAHGYSLLVMNSELDPALDPENIRVLQARRVDALMMCPVEETHEETVRAMSGLDIPLCIIEGDQPDSVRASYVHSDHAAGVVEAVRHLVRQGHRRIALLTGPARYRSARERRRGLDRAAAEAPEVTFIHRNVELNEEDGHRTFGVLLAERHRPTAVVVGGNRLLVGVLRAIESAGMEPGRDLAIVTSDALPLAAMFRPPLASIQRDGARIGRTAAEVLLARLADPAAAPGSVTLPVTYVPRASAAAAPSTEG
ncbi:MAG: LacI family DNA-binding transcriptional regulator [Chloroflexota bacterium]